MVQLDDLVAVTQELPDGRSLTHYGIVVEGFGRIEGASLATDTRRIAGDQTMPGEEIRRVDVQVLRTVPELWLPPRPGSAAVAAEGVHRDQALFLDQMERRLAVGLDQSGLPVYADFTFLNGEKGGHLSISGISGVAAKTSYALFLLYMLFETAEGRRLLGAGSPQTRALVFNVKGEDLLHLDRPNARFPSQAGAREQWRALGVEDPGRFERVRIYVPRSPASRPGVVVPDTRTRPARDVVTFGWSPMEFIRQGLLRFCFTDASDQRNQVSFVEQRVRVQLARWAHPMDGEPGCVVLAPPPPGTSFNVDRVLGQRRPERRAGEGAPFRDFPDLVDFLTAQLVPEDGGPPDPAWTGSVAQTTALAFIRRLAAQVQRVGQLVSAEVRDVTLDEPVTVVDIHALHEDAQRFVVGALLSRVFEEKQGQGREPLRFVVLDELNKYAPREGTSPIKDLLVDIAARGRSLGVLLIGAQQSAGDVDGAVVRNASVKVVGRLDAGESHEYRFLSPELRERAARFLPGTMVLDQPLIPAAIPIRFPFPAFATNVADAAAGNSDAEAGEVAEIFRSL
ncbi:MAG: ATP-binding protein [Chloroflexi bacterium]|nr:MAG: ATP-binding protein [Chloroflexota bacterium]